MSRRSGCRTAVVIAIVATLVPAADVAAHASTTVNCASKSLQGAINAAAANSTLLIKGSCSGTFTVDKNLTLKGHPTAILDGDDLGSVLTITGSPTVHLVHLTVTGGLASSGAGITSGGASLTLDKVTVTDNLAYDPATAEGGGIYATAGSVHLTSSSIVDNRVLAAASGPNDAYAAGGGIYDGGKLTISDSSVSSNRVTSTSPGANSAATGGGVYAGGSSLTVTKSHLNNNRLTASGSGSITLGGACECTFVGGSMSMSISNSELDGNISRSLATADQGGAGGGAIDASMTKATLTHSTLADNQVSVVGTGTSYNDDAAGAAMDAFASVGVTVTGSLITHNTMAVSSATSQALADGGAVYGRGRFRFTDTKISDTRVVLHAAGNSEASGGAIEVDSFSPYPASLKLQRSTIAGNATTSRSSAGSGFVEGGGILSLVPTSIVASTVSRNISHAIATGSHSALVDGGGVAADWDLMGSEPTDRITNSTIAENLADARSPTGPTSLQGGGLSVVDANAVVLDATIAHNSVDGSGTTVQANGGGVFVDSTAEATIEATIVALNNAPTNVSGPDCAGKLGSAGHNLVHLKSGCTFAAKSSDKVSESPHLGPLAANGGPTHTMALDPRSPALNAIAKSACAVTTDQRGVHRPQGSRCDIGAYERRVAKPKSKK